MEFLHVGNNPTEPIDSLRVNWYYRPKDIHRKVTDSRTVFASMHSDTCPLSSIRGKCTIEHKDMIADIDEFRKQQNHFWYDKLFDRYIQRFYEVIPTSKVLNVPEKIRKVLQERWKFVLVEPQRSKELCSAMKECKRCNGYCARYPLSTLEEYKFSLFFFFFEKNMGFTDKIPLQHRFGTLRCLWQQLPHELCASSSS